MLDTNVIKKILEESGNLSLNMNILIEEIKKLQKLNFILSDLVDYYEDETDRYNFNEEDIPGELKELEKEREIAESELNL